jgi:anaerobic ribonucleoside-triphosphate reductase activating protein
VPGMSRPAEPPTAIRLSRIHHPVTALGPGRRLGIWVQGCSLTCPGCMARDTWDPQGGAYVEMADVVASWLAVRREGASGVTISGGEPSEQSLAVSALASQLRQADAIACHEDGGPPLDILIFTGLNEVEVGAQAPELLASADALMLGRFDVRLPTDLVWRGSANQTLVPLTRVGLERYADHISRTTQRPDLQVLVEDDKIQTIGVPRIGDLRRVELLLRRRGIESGQVSWRP